MNNTQLIDYLDDEDAVVRVAAQLLIDTKTAFDEDELTLSEYKEIVANITDLETLDELSGHLERKQRVQQIFEVLRELMGAITLL